MKPPLCQYRPWPGKLEEPLCKEQDALFSGWVSALPEHMGFQPTLLLAVTRSEMKSAPPSMGGSVLQCFRMRRQAPVGESKGLGFGEP